MNINNTKYNIENEGRRTKDEDEDEDEDIGSPPVNIRQSYY